ncbi:MAG: membrane dipeptidase, partial [Chloroflexi bacterium]|nr:membrane dipeptidase [Chloroflexota bacterium]
DFCMEQPREWFEWIFSSQGSVPAASVAPTPQPYSHLKGFEDPTRFVDLAEGLLSRGYDDDDVRKIIGENWLRLFDKVWHADGPAAATPEKST